MVPVFVFMTAANVGSAQEGTGRTWLAHMFEHRALKGDPRLGNKNYKDEKKALEKLEQAYPACQEACLSSTSDANTSKTYRTSRNASNKPRRNMGLGGCPVLDLDTPLLMETDPIDGGYTYEGPLLQPWHGPGLDLDIPSFQAAMSDHL